MSSEQEYWHVPIATYMTALLFFCQQPTGYLSTWPFHYKYSIIHQGNNCFYSFFPVNINFSRTKNRHKGETIQQCIDVICHYCDGIVTYLLLSTKQIVYKAPTLLEPIIHSNTQLQVQKNHQGLNCSVILVSTVALSSSITAESNEYTRACNCGESKQLISHHQ